MQGWYKTVSNRPPTPSQVKLAKITTEMVEIYRQVPPPLGDKITIEADLFSIDDSIPSMADIKWVVHRLWSH